MGSTGKSSITASNNAVKKSITVGTSNGDYEITPMGNGFTVQLSGGDEEYFNNYNDAMQAIWVDAYWANAPLTDKKGLYNSDDLQQMIEFINANAYVKAEFLKRLPKNPDGYGIAEVINEGSAEEFDGYDSDVAEQFITLYQNFK